MMGRSDYYGKIHKVLGTQVKIQSLLHEHKSEVCLSPSVAKAFQSLVNTFLKDYSILANHADNDKDLLFSVTPKFHYYYHMGQRALFLNPRKGNTMIDEDFVGQAKHIVASCAHGTEAHAVPEKFFERYVWGKYINMVYPQK